MDLATTVTRVAFGIVSLLGVAGAVWLLRDGSALRDGGAVPEGGTASFSLARVQLWFWTVVILGSYLGVAVVLGETLELNSTCLILLGISATTTTGARILDGRSNPFASNAAAHQSEGFLVDILSDERGVSIHRFQTILFTLAYGVWFVDEVVVSLIANKPAFPTLEMSAFGLLGLSSTTYLALKAQEAPAPATTALPSDPDGILSDQAEFPQG